MVKRSGKAVSHRLVFSRLSPVFQLTANSSSTWRVKSFGNRLSIIRRYGLPPLASKVERERNQLDTPETRGKRGRANVEQPSSPVPAHPLDEFVTPERAARFREVLARRTTRVVVVLEDCGNPHNAAAALRSCDAMGLHRIYLVTPHQEFQVSRRVGRGADRYLDLRVFETIDQTYAALRGEGYRILASDLAGENRLDVQELAGLHHQQPLALVFGNERTGISTAAVAEADGTFVIPMVGLMQSLNLSVAVAVTLYSVRQAELDLNRPGDLPAEEQRAFYDQWIQRQYAERTRQPQFDQFGNPINVYDAGTKKQKRRKGPRSHGPMR